MGRFRDAVLGDELAISAELTLRRDSTAGDIREQADRLAGLADGIQVTDNPYAWVQMSALSASAILLDHGADPVPVLTCRDRDRNALRGDLLGMRELGVDSVMLMRGHRVPENHAVKAATVFDLTGRELIALAAGLAPPEEEGFLVGTGVRVFRPNRGWRADSLTARGRAGARFLQTQLCFNLDLLRHYLKRFEAAGLHRRFDLMVSLSPLPSSETARWVKENLGDSRIPPAVMQRLEAADDPQQEGVLICAELMRKLARMPCVSGVNLMTTGDPAALAATIRESGLRSA